MPLPSAHVLARRAGALLVLAAVLAGLPVAGRAEEELAAPPPPLAGGWSAAPTGDPDVVAAARAAVQEIKGGSGTLSAVEGAEQQVVAGVNYRLRLLLGDGERWDVTVWHKLDGSFAVTRSSVLTAPATSRLSLLPDGLRLERAGGAGEAIAFGAPRADVLAALAFRGEAELSSNAECGAGPMDFAGWTDGLTLLFQDDRFQGWSLDDRATTIALADGTAIGTSQAALKGKGPVSVEESTLGQEFLTGAGVSGLLSGPEPASSVQALWAGIDCVFR